MRTLSWLALALLALSPALSADRASPPAQEAQGPGGKRYVHAKVEAARYGEADSEYWIFEPAEPRPKSAPVVALLHGWMGMDPDGYRGWIDHLVKQGRVVVYPRYQAGFWTPPGLFTPNAAGALKEAFSKLDGTKHVLAEKERFALVGHSAGGIISANLAAVAAESGLPRARAVFSVQPGGEGFIPYADLSKIERDTLLVVIVGDRDTTVGETAAWTILKGARSVVPANRNFVRMLSDDHGAPGLSADHLSPASPLRVLGGPRAARLVTNALDWNGYWKLFDGLCDAAWHGRHREYCLGDTPQQRGLGKWSDGRPVREMEVVSLTAGAGADPGSRETAPAAPKTAAHRKLADLPYIAGPGAHARQKLDLYLPAGQKDFPLLFFLHGGGWSGGDKGHYQLLGQTLAAAGWGVCLPNYRLSPEVQHPRHAEDVAAAFAWLAKNAAAHGGRADKLVIGGHSAGAHLAALLAFEPRYLAAHGLAPSSIRGAILFAGVYDLEPHGDDGGWTGNLVRTVFGRDAKLLRSASPVWHANGRKDVPELLLFHGERDTVCAPGESSLLHAVARRNGLRSELFLLRDKDHLTILTDLLKAEEPTRQKVMTFLGRVAPR